MLSIGPLLRPLRWPRRGVFRPQVSCPKPVPIVRLLRCVREPAELPRQSALIAVAIHTGTRARISAPRSMATTFRTGLYSFVAERLRQASVNAAEAGVPSSWRCFVHSPQRNRLSANLQG